MVPFEGGSFVHSEKLYRAVLVVLMILLIAGLSGTFTLHTMRNAFAESTATKRNALLITETVPEPSLEPKSESVTEAVPEEAKGTEPEAVEELAPEEAAGMEPETVEELAPEETAGMEPEAVTELAPEETAESEAEPVMEMVAKSEPESEMKPEGEPPLRQRTELLVLVNPWNKMKENYLPELRQVTWGYEDEDQYMDARAAEDMIRMIHDCAEAGNDPFVCSAYRSMEKQEYLFNNKIARLVYEEGVDPKEAPAIAAMSVAIPGTSEHQLGLAADIIDYNYPYLDEKQEEMPTQKWLMEHCWEYGFILRYPNGKTDITGIIYEPWHYRYVGLEPAQEIHELNITLEEYLAEYCEPLE